MPQELTSSNTESDRKKTTTLPRYNKYQGIKDRRTISSVIDRTKRELKDKLAAIQYTDDYLGKEDLPPKRWKGCEQRSPERDCCKLLIEAFAHGKLDKRKVHKPKQPRQVKLSCIAENLPLRDSVMPQLFHLLDRFFDRREPGNAFEEIVFSGLNGFSDRELDSLRSGVDVFHKIEGPLEKRLFMPAYLNWSLDQPADADLIHWAMLDEGLRLTKTRGLEDLLVPGSVRPWARDFWRIDNTETIVAPWPWINEVNGLRTATHRKPIDLYKPEEYQETCSWNIDESSGEITPSCQQAQSPACEVAVHTDQHGTCLRVAQTRPGEVVTLVGFNYFSFNSRVILTKLENGIPSSVFDLDCAIIADTITPIQDNQGIIADHRVRDTLMFDVPEMTPDGLSEFPPGIYRIEVSVPNDIFYTLPDGKQPTEFTSNEAYLNVLPKENLKYRIWSDEAYCYDQTNGEWGSDEIYVRAYPAVFDPVTGSPQYLDPTFTRWDGVEDNDVSPQSWLWNIVGNPGNAMSINGLFGLGIIGWEVDSEDALSETIRSYDQAFTKFWNIVWKGVSAVGAGGIVAAAITAIFAKAAWWIALVVAVAVVLVILVVGLIWAAWAPPDRMILDVILLSESDLYDLTNRNTQLPGWSNYSVIPDVNVFVEPENKIGYLYQEERRYTCKSEGSVYGIHFRYQRDV